MRAYHQKLAWMSKPDFKWAKRWDQQGARFFTSLPTQSFSDCRWRKVSGILIFTPCSDRCAEFKSGKVTETLPEDMSNIL